MKSLFLVKLTAVAMILGIFSPSVGFVSTDSQGVNRYSVSSFQLSISLLSMAEARGARSSSMNRSGGNRNVNRNVSRDRNVNRNVNVNHSNRYYGGGHYGYYGGRAIVAWSSALVVGSMIAAASMPTNCTTFVTNGISYRQCGSSYYQPYYQGDTVVYKVVNSPY